MTVDIQYLNPDEAFPDIGDEEPWLKVEPYEYDGKYYGSGYGYKPNGEGVVYASLAESDVSLEKALEAARRWAEEYRVSLIHVRTEPEQDHA